MNNKLLEMNKTIDIISTVEFQLLRKKSNERGYALPEIYLGFLESHKWRESHKKLLSDWYGETCKWYFKDGGWIDCLVNEYWLKCISSKPKDKSNPYKDTVHKLIKNDFIKGLDLIDTKLQYYLDCKLECYFDTPECFKIDAASLYIHLHDEYIREDIMQILLDRPKSYVIVNNILK